MDEAIAEADGIKSLINPQAWLTAWEDDAPENLGSLFPRAREVLAADTEEHGWWKIDAAVQWLDAHPEVRRVAWIDDELAGEDPVLGVTFREVASEALGLAGVEALLIAPDPLRGATGDDAEAVESFLLGHAGRRGEDRAAPADPEPARGTPRPDDADPFASTAPASRAEDDDPFAAAVRTSGAVYHPFD